MPSHRLLAIVTALVLIGGAPGLHAEYTLSQLQQIEQLVLSKDCRALWAYLRANPGLMQGSDPLAVELRTFAQSTAQGQLDCYAPSPATASNLRRSAADARDHY